MSKQVTPEAFFDSLSLAHKLDNFLDGFKLEEIHLFSYFSSFLYCYAGNAISTWPHKYIVSNGYPFSDSINEAIVRHIQNGFFENKGEYFVISGRGTDEFNKFKTLSSFVKTEEMLNAATTTTILMPYAETLRALLNEPDIKSAEKLQNESWLNQMNFYPKFAEINKAIGLKNQDLVIPAVIWINYLTEKNKIEQ